MDKGTVIRTILLFVAFANQILAIYGKGAIPVSEDGLNTVYVAGSTIFTFVMSLITWWKNNYITKKGQAQRAALKAQNLAK